MTSIAPRGLDGATRAFTDLVGRHDITLGFGALALAIALLLGGLHALAPGPRQDADGGLARRDRGRRRDAFVLGASVTTAHTAGVVALRTGAVLSSTIAPETAYPWLGLASAVLAVGRRPEPAASDRVATAWVTPTRTRHGSHPRTRRWPPPRPRPGPPATTTTPTRTPTRIRIRPGRHAHRRSRAHATVRSRSSGSQRSPYDRHRATGTPPRGRPPGGSSRSGSPAGSSRLPRPSSSCWPASPWVGPGSRSCSSSPTASAWRSPSASRASSCVRAGGLSRRVADGNAVPRPVAAVLTRLPLIAASTVIATGLWLGRAEPPGDVTRTSPGWDHGRMEIPDRCPGLHEPPLLERIRAGVIGDDQIMRRAVRATTRHLRRLHGQRTRPRLHRGLRPRRGAAALRQHPHRVERHRAADHPAARGRPTRGARRRSTRATTPWSSSRGSGTTGAIDKLVGILNLRLPADLDDRYGLTGHIPREERPVVFIGPFEHHSNELPVARVDRRRRRDPRGPRRAHRRRPAARAELVRHADRPLKIGSFSAASNVTGIVTDTDRISSLLHEHGALAFWDFAAAGPYVDIDMNPTASPYPAAHKDAIVLSPHKFIGGPGHAGRARAASRAA